MIKINSENTWAKKQSVNLFKVFFVFFLAEPFKAIWANRIEENCAIQQKHT